MVTKLENLLKTLRAEDLRYFLFVVLMEAENHFSFLKALAARDSKLERVKFFLN